MTDDSSPGSAGPGPVFDFISQLRRMADQLDVTKSFGAAMPAVPKIPSLPSAAALPMLPSPGALSAAQLTAMSSAVAAQRGSIDGLLGQLRAFDEQLEVLEKILAPLAEWSRSWAEFESSMIPPGVRKPGKPDEKPGGKSGGKPGAAPSGESPTA